MEWGEIDHGGNSKTIMIRGKMNPNDRSPTFSIYLKDFLGNYFSISLGLNSKRRVCLQAPNLFYIIYWLYLVPCEVDTLHQFNWNLKLSNPIVENKTIMMLGILSIWITGKVFLPFFLYSDFFLSTHTLERHKLCINPWYCCHTLADCRDQVVFICTWSSAALLRTSVETPASSASIWSRFLSPNISLAPTRMCYWLFHVT